MIKDAEDQFPDYNVRIYFDQSSVQFVKPLSKHKNVELYYYYFPDFFDQDKKVHYGTFGTVVRYLPLFDFKHHASPFTIIFDTDSNLRGKTIKTIKYFERKKDLRLLYRFSNCYIADPRLHFINLSITYPIISSFLCQKETLPQKLLVDFMNDCLLNDCSHYMEYLKKRNANISYTNKFSYGVDEYFLNHYYLTYYINNQIPFEIVIFYKDTEVALHRWLKELNTKKYKIVKIKVIGKSKSKNGNKSANKIGGSNTNSTKIDELINLTYDNLVITNKTNTDNSSSKKRL